MLGRWLPDAGLAPVLIVVHGRREEVEIVGIGVLLPAVDAVRSDDDAAQLDAQIFFEARQDDFLIPA